MADAARTSRLRHIKLVRMLVTIAVCTVVGVSHLTRINGISEEQMTNGRPAWKEGILSTRTGKSPGGDVFKADTNSRRLLQYNAFAYDNDIGDEDDDKNCTERGIMSFPKGVFTNKERRNGAVVVNFVVAFYLCGVIGYVCSVYFVPSLEILCKRLKLQPDVAGATFMAAGSSAPELFSSAIGVFYSEDDTGMSAIVGSAAFNIFIIIAMCCFLAGQELHLNWWPFVRDCAIYIISIGLLVLFIHDGEVQWWEGLILFCGYIVYIIIMYFNPYLSERAENLAAKWQNWREDRRNRRSYSSSWRGNDTVGLLADDHGTDKAYGAALHQDTSMTPNGGLSNGNPFLDPDDYIPFENGHPWKDVEKAQRSRTLSGSSSVRTDHALMWEQDTNVFSPPSSWFFRVLWVLGLPAVLLCFLTIPDCRKEGVWRRLYFLTFVLATVWLAATAYVLYWMIVVIGYTLNIPDTVMGISFLAGGTSVPDLIASVLVARDGYGDMALSNIIGSNIFEVFFCLGFLWMIFGIANDAPVEITSQGLSFSSISLLFTVAFVLVVIHLNSWKLDIKVGIICLFVYAAFISIAVLWELGYLGAIDSPVFCAGPS